MKIMNIEKEILITLECILKMLRRIPFGDNDLINKREKYLESTIKRIEEVLEGIKNVA